MVDDNTLKEVILNNRNIQVTKDMTYTVADPMEEVAA